MIKRKKERDDNVREEEKKWVGREEKCKNKRKRLKEGMEGKRSNKRKKMTHEEIKWKVSLF